MYNFCHEERDRIVEFQFYGWGQHRIIKSNLFFLINTDSEQCWEKSFVACYATKSTRLAHELGRWRQFFFFLVSKLLKHHGFEHFGSISKATEFMF